MSNTFISSFCQNNYCVSGKDTSALNNRIRDISSYSALLASTSMPPSASENSQKAHIMLIRGECFDTQDALFACKGR